MCTVLVASSVAGGPAQAGVGDIVDEVVSGAGGQLEPDSVRDTVDATVDGVAQTADELSEDARDVVRTATEAATQSPEEASPGTTGDATTPSAPAGDSRRDDPGTAAPTPPEQPRASAADSSSRASSSPHPQRGDSGQPDRERASAAATRGSRAEAHGSPVHRHLFRRHRAPQMVAAPAPPEDAASAPRVEPACATDSLAVDDLRRCARANPSLPGLGGVPMALPPAGLVMVGLGLVLLARGRRRRTVLAPTT